MPPGGITATGARAGGRGVRGVDGAPEGGRVGVGHGLGGVTGPAVGVGRVEGGHLGAVVTRRRGGGRQAEQGDDGDQSSHQALEQAH